MNTLNIAPNNTVAELTKTVVTIKNTKFKNYNVNVKNIENNE